MYIIVWNLFAYFGMKFLYFKGYELGGKAVDFLVGPQGEALRESVTMLGGIVIGAVSATWISVTTSFTMTAAGAKKPFLDLQNIRWCLSRIINSCLCCWMLVFII